MAMKWSSSCGSNFNAYMEQWDMLSNKNDTAELPRPPILATLDSNVTVVTALLAEDGGTPRLVKTDGGGRIS